MMNQMDQLNKYYVYLYRDPSRGNERIYVGKGQGYRHTSHLKRTDMHPFVQRLQFIKKNGVKPDISFLCKDIDEELAYLVEEEAILKYGRVDLKTGPLLNLSNGGLGPTNPTAETRRKIGDATRGTTWSSKLRASMEKARQNPEWSEKTSKAVSEQSKRQWQDPVYRAKLVVAVGENKRKPCTIDGITIYHKRGDLIAALGCGKKGLRHPNFRFVDK